MLSERIGERQIVLLSKYKTNAYYSTGYYYYYYYLFATPEFRLYNIVTHVTVLSNIYGQGIKTHSFNNACKGRFRIDFFFFNFSFREIHFCFILWREHDII